MKKTLLAAALTVGFAGVAQAETQVTLYGIIDTGIGYERSESRSGGVKTKSTRTGIRNGVQSGNRWGLRGTEDLGNGLRAVFQLESGFDSGTGHQQQSGRLFGRQATLGLQSDSWGQVDIGRQTNVASKYLPGIIDPFGGGFGQANAGTSFSAADTIRYDNSIIYQTPNFSGFQFGIGYSFNAAGAQTAKVSGADDNNNRAITAGLRYANGPIGVALTYDRIKNSAADASAQQWALGGAYDFEVVKVSAAFGQARKGFVGRGADVGLDRFAGVGIPSGANNALYAAGAFGNNDEKANMYMVGLSAPVGAGTVLASWQMVDPRDGYGSDAKNQHVYSLGYTYGLSKRTNLYAYGSHRKNTGFARHAKTDVVGVGLRHQF